MYRYMQRQHSHEQRRGFTAGALSLTLESINNTLHPPSFHLSLYVVSLGECMPLYMYIGNLHPHFLTLLCHPPKATLYFSAGNVLQAFYKEAAAAAALLRSLSLCNSVIYLSFLIVSLFGRKFVARSSLKQNKGE